MLVRSIRRTTNCHYYSHSDAWISEFLRSRYPSFGYVNMQICKLRCQSYTSTTTSPFIKNLSEPGVKENERTVYRNPAGVQMITDELYKQVFINTPRKQNFPEDVIDKVKQHLSSHLLWNHKIPVIPSLNLQVPQLQGESIDDHFRIIAEDQTLAYKKLIKELIEGKIPETPSEWILNEGWTKYSSDGSTTSVSFPEEDAYVFDVEVCVSNGHVPTIACAVSSKGWYSWCSPTLLKGNDRDKHQPITLNDLIPFETSKGEIRPGETATWREKLIVGHNVSYDRARIKEQYFLEETKLRFMDTMSLHIAVSGITSYQRALKMTMKSGLQSVTPKQREDLMIAGSLEWNDISSLNSLRDVYKLYCNGKELDKETKKFFVNGNIPEIRNNFQSVMSYCAQDVKATHEVFVNLMPSYYERFPHPVTLSGMLEMGMTYLPINSNWVKYINQSEETYRRLEKEMKSVLMQKAEAALNLLDGEKYKEDPWLWDLDWKVSKVRTKKTKPKQSKNEVVETHETENPQQCASEISRPAWFKKLFYKETDEDFMPGPSKISTSMRIIPKLLRLSWYGFPLHYSKKGGWGYLTKRNEAEKVTTGDKGRSYYEAVDNEENDATITTLSQNNGLAEEELELLETSKFPYDEWLRVWENNRDNLVRRVSEQNTAEHTQLMEGCLRSTGEDVAQELKDFLNGLNSISSIGLRNGKRKKGNGSFPRRLDGASPHPKCDFIPLPHKDGVNFKVGNPLAKDFLNKIEAGTLSSGNGEDVANKVVRLSKMVSYWRNNRDRIMEQVTVWLNDSELAFSREGQFEYGAILPQVSVAGTLTRRAVERTWMTASNAYRDRVGSELKGIIQAPPGYHFVGADVDSQELWIASVIGDAHFGGFHGSTALGWMTLQGNKNAGTDMHSKTASLIGIERDQAKILNYGRIYGAGVTFAERLLQQFSPQLSNTDARIKARTMYKMTKGQRKYLLNDEAQKLIESLPRFHDKQHAPLSKEELQNFIRCLEYPPIDYMDFVKKVVWDEGTESPMFNRLEEIALMDCPKTPLLGSCISRSLVPSVVHQDFMTSRVNWVVQSSAVDYLHIMLTSIRWLFGKYKINGRFVISVHDEVRYLVKSEDKSRAALALQITNLLTRSLSAHNLGINDLPESVAFFSSVDIDKVLRKDVTEDCVTPSNPDGLEKGYDIPQGQSLTIHDLLLTRL